MIKTSGSWVAVPTPFDSAGNVDLGGLKALVDFQVANGTEMLLCMGSAGESAALTFEERQKILPEIVKHSKGKISVFFTSTVGSTATSIKFAKFAESEGADGVIFTAPPYFMPPQPDIKQFLYDVMSSVSIPTAVYNNPGRTAVMIEPDTIAFLVKECPNFALLKEAAANMEHLCRVMMAVGDKVKVFAVDAPNNISNLLPLMGMGATGINSFTGNIIPQEMVVMSKPWDTIEQVKTGRELYFKWLPLIKALSCSTSPIPIKAGMRLLGLPCGFLRKPYQELEGPGLDNLKRVMEELGVFAKYGKA